MSLALKDVSVSYPTKQIALRSIDCSINQGEFVAIVGNNGSGKTTFMQCLNGLIPHAIEATFKGNVEINQKNTRKMTIRDISLTVGSVFQDPDLMIFNDSVEEEIMFGLRNFHLNDKEKRLQNALAETGLSGFEKRDPHTLSEGQKQRLCIAAALALGTNYLLLDEPSAHLDYSGTLQLYQLLKKLHSQGRTIVVIEHDTDMIWDFIERTIVMHNGEIVFDGNTKEIFKRQNAGKLEQWQIKPAYKAYE